MRIFSVFGEQAAGGTDRAGASGYFQYWNYAKKKGYSGTAVFAKQEPLRVLYGIGEEEHDQEGRVVTLEYENFYFVTVYTPNSQSELARLDYRMRWEEAFLGWLKKLEQEKPVVFCGDLNVAHKEIDLKNPKTNRKNAGFTDEERNKFNRDAEQWFYRYIPVFSPGSGGDLQLDVVPVSRAGEKCGMAVDYFMCIRSVKGTIAGAKIHTR